MIHTYDFAYNGQLIEYTAECETDFDDPVESIKFGPVQAEAWQRRHGGWILEFSDGVAIELEDGNQFAQVRLAYQSHLLRCLRIADAARGPVLAYLTHDELYEAFAYEFGLVDDSDGVLELTDQQTEWIDSLNLGSIASMMTSNPESPAKIGIYVDSALTVMGLFNKFGEHFKLERAVVAAPEEDEE